MIAGIRQKTVVGAGGKVEILSPDLPSGTRVEVIVLVEPVEQDTTEYLLSTEANCTHLHQALRDLENPASHIYVDLAAR
jgi:antitoxin YefM